MSAAAWPREPRDIEAQPGNEGGDGALARAALGDDAQVWAAFVARFTPLVRHQLGRTLAAGRDLAGSDAVDEALGEFWIALIKNERAWLRRFDPSRNVTLATWLGVLAWDVGNKQLRRLRRRRGGGSLEALDLDGQPWSDAGARYLARLAAIEPEPPVKRSRCGSR